MVCQAKTLVKFLVFPSKNETFWQHKSQLAILLYKFVIYAVKWVKRAKFDEICLKQNYLLNLVKPAIKLSRWPGYSRVGRGFHLELIHSLAGCGIDKVITGVGRHVSISFSSFGTQSPDLIFCRMRRDMHWHDLNYLSASSSRPGRALRKSHYPQSRSLRSGCQRTHERLSWKEVSQEIPSIIKNRTCANANLVVL